MNLKKLPDSWNLARLREDALLILVLWALHFLLLIAALLSGSVILSSDEPIRWGMSMSWAQSPYFAPSDHVWLGGYFAAVGSYLKYVGWSYTAARLLAVIVSLLGVAGCYLLAKELLESRLAGFLAGLVLIGGYVHTWLSLAPMPGTFTIALNTWALYAILSGIRREVPWRLLTGSFFLGLSCAFRYEQWLLAGAFGGAMIVLAAMRRISLPVLIGCGALSSFYIITWIISSRIQTGDAFGFLHTTVAMAEHPPNPFAETLHHLYWWELFAFSTAAAGCVLCLAFGNRYQRGYALLLIAFSLLFIGSMKVGTALGFWRIIQGWRSLVVPMAPALVIFPMMWWPKPAFRSIMRAASLVVCAIYIARQADRAQYPPLWEFNNDVLAVGHWLHFEQKNRQFLRDYPLDVRIVYLAEPHSEDGPHYASMRYLAHYPHFYYQISMDEGYAPIVITRLDEELPGFREDRRYGMYRVLVQDSGE